METNFHVIDAPGVEHPDAPLDGVFPAPGVSLTPWSASEIFYVLGRGMVFVPTIYPQATASCQYYLGPPQWQIGSRQKVAFSVDASIGAGDFYLGITAPIYFDVSREGNDLLLYGPDRDGNVEIQATRAFQPDEFGTLEIEYEVNLSSSVGGFDWTFTARVVSSSGAEFELAAANFCAVPLNNDTGQLLLTFFGDPAVTRAEIEGVLSDERPAQTDPHGPIVDMPSHRVNGPIANNAPFTENPNAGIWQYFNFGVVDSGKIHPELPANAVWFANFYGSLQPELKLKRAFVTVECDTANKTDMNFGFGVASNFGAGLIDVNFNLYEQPGLPFQLHVNVYQQRGIFSNSADYYFDCPQTGKFNVQIVIQTGGVAFTVGGTTHTLFVNSEVLTEISVASGNWGSFYGAPYGAQVIDRFSFEFYPRGYSPPAPAPPQRVILRTMAGLDTMRFAGLNLSNMRTNLARLANLRGLSLKELLKQGKFKLNSVTLKPRK